ncbi:MULTISPECIES: sigma-54-dependent Fis family transcriptional regulator [unclassified Shewanella]|jgi:PAS domain S-box-containing protein|uniref:sigma-54 interaction domain-containing protein n=1 Tax=unclassified Shewanella TaxID=196818 RepID=UPI000C7E3CBF|nr:MULTISPECIES: sigma 54-interacting transcriptional regulator [unclassified Shewanella]PKG56208.1 Fis family transcriptional regulator [Shewanella sp. GutDb-MelDb]PKG75961.1 Fis family transcriptional regulator [Shewanella sp. GutCb]
MSAINLKQKTAHADFLPENQLILNAVSEGIYGFDLDGNAVFINPAAEKMTGWQTQELLGKNIHDCHHHSHNDGSHYPKEDCPIYNTLRDGTAREITHEVFWRKDGSSFPVHYTSTPVYKDGVLMGVVAIFRDISIQKQTEQSLRQALEQVQALSEKLSFENQYLQLELADRTGDVGISGESQQINQLIQQIKLVANTESTVLISGENGTGKELVARNLHRLSNRADKPLVSVNCAAFSTSLLESELFGHEKGAYTGATSRRKGRFELANNGTLFLDEVAELSLEAQSKLLRVIQEQEFERVGSSQTIKVDIRLITATHHDLLKRVEQGLFRMDLYYRLNVFPIVVPPLRSRLSDIPELVSHLIQELNRKLGKKISKVSQRGMQNLTKHSWPGNVRELQNVLEREMILSTGPVLEFGQLASEPQAKTSTAATNAKQTLAEIEKAHILKILKQSQWRISGPIGAAAILGMPPSTLRSRMLKLAIARPI